MILLDNSWSQIYHSKKTQMDAIAVFWRPHLFYKGIHACCTSSYWSFHSVDLSRCWLASPLEQITIYSQVTAFVWTWAASKHQVTFSSLTVPLGFSVILIHWRKVAFFLTVHRLQGGDSCLYIRKRKMTCNSKCRLQSSLTNYKSFINKWEVLKNQMEWGDKHDCTWNAW